MIGEIRKPKISAAQLMALMTLSRLFILLIFVPNTHESVSGTASLLSVAVGYFLTVLALVPLDFLLKNNPNQNLYEIARQCSPKVGKAAAAGFYLVCTAIASETATQFNLFLTGAVYPRANKQAVNLIFCAAALYLAFLGLEALSRTSAIMLFVTVVSLGLLGFGLWKFFDTLNLISPLYDGWSAVIQGSVLYFTQNMELIAFALLVSYLNQKSARKSFFAYHTAVSVILTAVGLASIIVLGNYGETRSFPIYTMFVLSGSNVFYRFDYILIAIWVAVSLIRAALYFMLSAKMLDELSGRRLGKKGLWAQTAAVVLLSGFSTANIRLFGLIYRFLASGIPVYLLLLLLPLALLFLQWKRAKQGGKTGIFQEGERA